MIAFWSLAVLLVLVALAIVLVPMLRGGARVVAADRDAAVTLLYRDELAQLRRDHASGRFTDAQFEEARREIERRLIDDAGAGAFADGTLQADVGARRTALALGLSLPVLAVVLYLQLGNPRGFDPAAVQAPQAAAHEITPQQIEAMVERLAERLKNEPANAEGWMMLARSYTATQKFEAASKAYAHAITLVPNDASLLADYADSLAMAQGRKLSGKPNDLVRQALAIDPRHVKALALAGSAEFERRDYIKAAQYWESALAQVKDDSEFARAVRSSADEARKLAKMPPRAALVQQAAPAPALAQAQTKPAAPAQSSATASADSAVSGTVTLAPDLGSRIAPGDTLFVYARPASGGRMPLAILRATAAALPYAFRLDDSLAMTPMAKLSGQTQVVVSARISKSGTATPQPGDLFGNSGPIAPGVNGLKLTIDQVVK